MTPETHIHEIVAEMEEEGIKTSLGNICKASEFDFKTTKTALRNLCREGSLDKDDDGRYFVRS
jgi:hypothetical protein